MKKMKQLQGFNNRIDLELLENTINALIDKVNSLESDLNKHKYGNTSSISPYDLSSRKRHINVYR